MSKELNLNSSGSTLELDKNANYVINYCRLSTPVPPDLVQLTINVVFDTSPYAATNKAVHMTISFKPYGEECYKTFQIMNNRITSAHKFYRCHVACRDAKGEATLSQNFDFILGFTTTPVSGPTESTSLFEKKNTCVLC
ncbi:hypothetical protein BNJ_00338 [Kaumoebavirus]|uniref:hypothetical protein n=1 Tax=Kaumoebavirus TaxID=1859492 RepID=UPI0009C3C325|nr:hypothetical protein BNJ_00338 [Kaumoebavirus]ARA72158.1 hypothetical protein BNJ_00338 [Kaumoebavirus]